MRLRPRLLAAAVMFLCAGSAMAQRAVTDLPSALPVCEVGSTWVTLVYDNVDVRVPAGGTVLRCHTSIIVNGGDILINGPVQGMTPHATPRPDGDPGYSSYNLSLETKCGETGIGESTGGHNDRNHAYCGDIKLNAPIYLVGELGMPGANGSSAGSGGLAGAGGSGGAFTAISVNNIECASVIDTSGAEGGAGGTAGQEWGCDAAGIAMGGPGAVGGSAGAVTLMNHKGTPNTATISLKPNYAITAIGGNGGSGGMCGKGAQHACGGVAGTGGSGGNGGPGGTVKITGKRVVSTWSSSELINTRGGGGGSAGQGCDGGFEGSGLIVQSGAGTSGTICLPPVHGGPAGDAGNGAAAGNITIATFGTPLSGSDPGVLSGSILCTAPGGDGGAGARGGSGGYLIEDDCCGHAGLSREGGPGGIGGNISFTTSRISLSGAVQSRGGSGGIGGISVGSACPCWGARQGGLGGPGGRGGDFTLKGANPFGTNVSYALWGGCGGAGGGGVIAVPSAPCAPGGAHGSNGLFTDLCLPLSLSLPFDSPCSGTRGPEGPGQTCNGEPYSCTP